MVIHGIHGINLNSLFLHKMSNFHHKSGILPHFFEENCIIWRKKKKKRKKIKPLSFTTESTSSCDIPSTAVFSTVQIQTIATFISASPEGRICE